MSTNARQLFLLADHIKLSLLERQRAISLNLELNKQDGHISRSLETLREGIEALETQQAAAEAEEAGEGAPNSADLSRLRTQYRDLSSQFHGPSSTTSPTITAPNDPSLSSDFLAAQSTRPRSDPASSLRSSSSSKRIPNAKSVRFRDNPSPPVTAPTTSVPTRADALLPYRDDPSDLPAALQSQDGLDNRQIHEFHKQVIREQDEQLDRLGASVGRQRELSIQMGDELDEQGALLEDVEEGVDRHQGQLDRAKRRLDGVARKARENWSWVVIGILICVLLLLIIVLKK
ncbi:hypothetical protein LTR28_007950 [Elasticomyces elasticus]|nr:hypothetical protein LTR28_007950 [Elasticomyces elasticus]